MPWLYLNQLVSHPCLLQRGTKHAEEPQLWEHGTSPTSKRKEGTMSGHASLQRGSILCLSAIGGFSRDTSIREGPGSRNYSNSQEGILITRVGVACGSACCES